MSRQQHIDQLNQRRTAIMRDIERVAAKARDARQGLAAQAKTTTQRVKNDATKTFKDLAADARDVAMHARSDTTDMAKERVRQARQRAAEAIDPRPAVREQPLIGLAAGVGVGFALAMLAVPRRHERVRYVVRQDYP